MIELKDYAKPYGKKLGKCLNKVTKLIKGSLKSKPNKWIQLYVPYEELDTHEEEQ